MVMTVEAFTHLMVIAIEFNLRIKPGLSALKEISYLLAEQKLPIVMIQHVRLLRKLLKLLQRHKVRQLLQRRKVLQLPRRLQVLRPLVRIIESYLAPLAMALLTIKLLVLFQVIISVKFLIGVKADALL